VKPAGVKTNGRLESSDPDVYAVGDARRDDARLDCARARIALAGPANRQGRIAGRQRGGRASDLSRSLGHLNRERSNMTADLPA